MIDNIKRIKERIIKNYF